MASEVERAEAYSTRRRTATVRVIASRDQAFFFKGYPKGFKVWLQFPLRWQDLERRIRLQRRSRRRSTHRGRCEKH